MVSGDTTEERKEVSSMMDLTEVLRLHGLWLSGDTDGVKADLKGADLSEVNLSGVNLMGADLMDANLRGANLGGANLRMANLMGANLSNVILMYADLWGADLRMANLWGVDLRDTNLDYSCWPLSCKSLNVGHTDDRIVAQLLYHTLRAAERSDGPLSKKLLSLKTAVDIANRFHRVEACGPIDRRKTKG